jgi:putative ATP-dependent endonuclease of the OLD family
MKISHVRIENFRCIRELNVVLEDTTVFIGANNSGKTSILQAVRIALSRLWGRRGTGFTEHDVHCPGETHDPKTALPVRVLVRLEERESETWDPDMVSALDELVVLNDLGRNLISLRVTCEWNQESKAFEPAWEFLDASGQPLTQKAQRATNLSGFFSYVPLFYLDALRDAAGEFNPRSSLWGGLLKSVRIPDAIQTEVQSSLDDLDAQLLAADPRLADIAKTISHAAKIAVGQSEGDAKLRMLPMNTWDLISRAAVVMKNENLRPWLPLDHHGQGLQSLSVLFLFQAAAFQQLEEEQPGIEPIFLLEEPEAHLHPQAARILWDRVSELPGQKLVATHSPYFVQHVPLHNLRLVRMHQGRTELAFMPRSVVSDLPWNEGVAQLAAHQGQMLTKDPATGKVSASSWFDEATAAKLAGCYKSSTDQELIRTAIANLRHESRGMLTRQEEHELSFLGRRIRGEIFFARRWILVEGQSEYVLLHAIGRALEYPLDRHGIAVIDFQNNGDADTYAALATSFAIPWSMITDAGDQATKFRAQLIKRGFVDADLVDRVKTLTPPNSLEDQLLADGHETRLRATLAEATSNSALICSLDDFLKRLKNKKIPCISRLALQVEGDVTLAQAMPKPFVDLVQALKGGAL